MENVFYKLTLGFDIWSLYFWSRW